MKILVIAEHDNKKIKPSTLSTISAGLKINENIEIWNLLCFSILEMLLSKFKVENVKIQY